MRKNGLVLLAMLISLPVTAGVAMADNIFEPVAVNYSYVETPKTIQQTEMVSAPNVVDADLIAATDTTTVNPVADNYQGAITYLENEQVELRTKLQGLNTQYTEVEQRYKEVSLERKNTKKAIRETEKKIKTLEKTKEKLRKADTVI